MGRTDIIIKIRMLLFLVTNFYLNLVLFELNDLSYFVVPKKAKRLKTPVFGDYKVRQLTTPMLCRRSTGACNDV